MSLWDRLPAELQRKVLFDARRLQLADLLASMPKTHIREPVEWSGVCGCCYVRLHTPNGTEITIGRQDDSCYEFATVSGCQGQWYWICKADGRQIEGGDSMKL